MNLIRVLTRLPIWVLVSSLFSTTTAARPHSAAFFISGSVEENSILEVSAKMDAPSPGTPVYTVVNHQDLNKKILIALIVSSSLLCAMLLFLLYFLFCRYRTSKHSYGRDKGDFDSTKSVSLNLITDRIDSSRKAHKKSSVAVIEYRILESATDNFNESNILGESICGRLYKACFDDKSCGTVKKLNAEEQDAEKEFENEVNWLTKIRHQNVISLLGHCIHGESRFLVYEMMQNGSLESQLHGPSRGSSLSWNLRMKIAVDIARGLEHLHERCNPPVVHRDLKSSNILLDSHFNAKLSDFGLAITLGTLSKSLKLSETLDCVAPEYLLEGKLTDKSDVYAFGVILLELLIGKFSFEKPSSENQSIVKWAVSHLSDRAKLPSFVDPVIKDTMDLKHLYQVAAVAVLCVQPEPSYRPLITDVLHSLIPLVPQELGGSLRIS